MASPGFRRVSSRALTCTARSLPIRQWNKTSKRFHASSKPPKVHQSWDRPSAAVLAAAATVALIYTSSALPAVHAEPPVEDKPEIIIEESKKKKGASKEENRNLISSQHLQVKKSWENPGVYAWGSNTGKVVAPDSNEAYIRLPRRIPYFDDVLLRDLKLDRFFGAAILENGDLVQWGQSYDPDNLQPTTTLRGKDLTSVSLSRDRIIALSKSGQIYSIPVSKIDQTSGSKPSSSSWIPFWPSTSSISYRIVKPPNLSYNERVTAISSGLSHCLLLTSSGRVFSFASSTETYPARGQLGVPGITWHTRPTDQPYDHPHELTTLRGFNIASVATGDTHSMCLDKEGRLFTFGDNSSGQLGFDYSTESPFLDAPSLLPINRLYTSSSQTPRVTDIFAGGSNSFFTVDATRIASPSDTAEDLKRTPLGRITADTWAMGLGLQGMLGTNKWTHHQYTPVKIPALSGLFEFDERTNSTVPIRIGALAVGSTHASTTLKNVTYLDASERGSENDTNWGADCLFWGGNEYYQIGNGKRANLAQPTYIAPLDMDAEVKEGGRKGELHRFHITPRHKVKLGGRKIDLEQRVVCGRHCTAVYSAV